MTISQEPVPSLSTSSSSIPIMSRDIMVLEKKPQITPTASSKSNETVELPVQLPQRLERFRAWSQVFVSFLLVVNGFGYFSSFGLFEGHWTTTLDESASSISWVGSLSLFLLFFLGVLSGPLMDRDYFRSILCIGCALQLLAVFATSAVSRYWQLILAQGLVQGLGNGMTFTPCVTLVAIWFTERRAFALSLAACGAPVGGLIFTAISRQLSETIGYPWTIRIMGFVVLFNSIIILILARPRRLGNGVKRSLVDIAAFKEPTYLLFSIGLFFILWGLYIAYFYTTTFGKEIIGISESDSLTLLMILNGAGVPGRIVPAYLADRWFGTFSTLLPFSFGVGLTLVMWSQVHTKVGFYVFVVIYGVCANAVQTLFPSTLSQLTTDPSKMGQRVGMALAVGSLACLTGPPLAGALIGIGNGSYLYAQLFGGCSVIIGFLFLTAARWSHLREEVFHVPNSDMFCRAQICATRT
ncbi:MFS monocarboxylate transporter-like protein [Annulohypoxylon bovei var. microspora]|nr:MFS monocarboxylate transporter-like protein [Annulohypoxylon bovei var. microspora]